MEMRDLGPAPWQLKFHRDRDSLPIQNGTRDDITLEIGNTSTTDKVSVCKMYTAKLIFRACLLHYF
jgi:hypothetical protein